MKTYVKGTPCQRCGVELRDPDSIARGFGPECALTQSAQLAAVRDLQSAMVRLGYFDPLAERLLIDKKLLEDVLNHARNRSDYSSIKKHTLKLKQIMGRLTARELHRRAGVSLIQEVA